MNYTLCTEKAYSNEKVSTLLAIMDYLLHTMIKRHMLFEEGFKLLKDILAKHMTQRPPFSIFIFTQTEVQDICNFMLKTFFRHFTLYEYSFKPKVELMLMTVPKGGIPTKNSQEEDLAQGVSEAVGNLDLDTDQAPGGDMGQDMSQADPTSPINAGDKIDWEKVGRIYKPESAVEHIVAKEMGRLKMAFDQTIEVQDTTIEEKHKAAPGGKKK